MVHVRTKLSVTASDSVAAFRLIAAALSTGCHLGGSFAAGVRIATLPTVCGCPDSESYWIPADVR